MSRRDAQESAGGGFRGSIQAPQSPGRRDERGEAFVRMGHPDRVSPFWNAENSVSVAPEIEGISDNFEGIAKKIEGIGNTLEGISNTWEGIAQKTGGMGAAFEGSAWQHRFDNLTAARATVARSIEHTNTQRTHSALKYNTPRQTYLTLCNPPHQQAA